MEDGELKEDSLGTVYSSALEWPGEGSSWEAGPSDSTPDVPSTSQPTSAKRISGVAYTHDRQGSAESGGFSPPASTAATSFRLLVCQSTILPKKHTLAVLDGYTEVQFGRDKAPAGSDTPRIRLKEMEVSKVHATVYWDQQRLEWAVVDMGSKHGTYVASGHAPSTSSSATASVSASLAGIPFDPRGTRLSPPRVASIPRPLKHLDKLSIGTTTFVVHIHENRMPCVDCSPKGGDELPLFDARTRESEPLKRKREDIESETPPAPREDRDPRKALNMLKRSLLSRHESSHMEAPAPKSYVDRSARRRALHPATPTDTPGIATPQHAMPPEALPSPPPAPVSAPPTPLPSTNIGHRLLMKQGWQPGMSLGPSETEPIEGSVALVEPLNVSGNSSRAGLGMPRADAATPDMSWREEAKLRRFALLKAKESNRGG